MKEGRVTENRLARETSPYLLQHAHNPVDWYPWGEEAFARARAEDKPIFLSVGYSTCYWCHVMERESFENEQVAAEMNQRFINIKVDREERPDVDQLYMAAVQVLTRQGGWPMSVFLTPDLRPFYGGTYFSPQDMYGRAGVFLVLRGIDAAYREARSQARMRQRRGIPPDRGAAVSRSRPRRVRFRPAQDDLARRGVLHGLRCGGRRAGRVVLSVDRGRNRANPGG